jgi:hypothetical protein
MNKCLMRALMRSLIGILILGGSLTAKAQTSATQGMQTFSPYTPEQIRAFNNQKISPAEGPFGPVDLTEQQLNSQKKPSLDSKLFNVPAGEQEAQALETQSAEPYEPMTPAISF